MTQSPIRLILLFVAVLGLAACQSSEERAEEHYQSALALLAEGDLERATVEFRNVFQLNGLHVEARQTYAEALRGNNQLAESYSQYLRLAEQAPDNIEARIALSEMAIDNQNWEQLRLHGARAVALAPEDERVMPIGINLDYALAIENEDNTARRDVADRAALLLESQPENLGLYRILIDSALRDNDGPRVLDLVNAALEFAPENRDLHNTRLGLLAEREDGEAIEEQLLRMIDVFTEDTTLTPTLLRFYLSQGQRDLAESFMREQVAEAPDDDTNMRLALVQFLSEVRGSEAAVDELNTLIDEAPQTNVYRMVRAAFQFESGETEQAIAEMQALIESDDITATELNDARVTLARMLAQTGNIVGARRLVAETLEADSSNIEALKLEANWLIDDDRADEAIGMLRQALEESPNDSEAMTLMARAHQRNGNDELARDFLSLAFEASNSAPAETLRYARALATEELYLSAEEALINALRLTPGNPDLLRELGRVYIAMEDWGRAEQVEVSLRRLDTEQAIRLANGLQAARLAAEGRIDETVEFLEGLADGAPDGDLGADIAVVQALLLSGDTEGALEYARNAATEQPDDLRLIILRGATEGAIGDLAAAEESYRSVLEQDDQIENVWVELVRVLYAQERADEAEVVLEQALVALPDALNLLWAHAGFLERSGDYDGAIAVYERLYEAAPNSAVVANNLASMLTSYRDDTEGLARAYAIARRLRNAEVPQFQDTYGWIVFRRGDIEEARPYLEAAASALPDDPLVQYHYGALLASEQRHDQALTQFLRVVELTEADDDRPQIVAARSEVERLSAIIAEQEAEAAAEAAAEAEAEAASE